MKVAVNCWILRNKELDGIGYFTINAVSRMIRDNPGTHFQILCDKKIKEAYFDFENVSKHHIFPPFRHPLLYFFYMELVLPFFLWKYQPNVFLSVDGILSLLSPCKQVAIIHDINFEHNPKDLKLKNRIYYRFFFKRFAHKAKRIATVSDYSKSDIARYYKIDPSTIDNVSCASGGQFRPHSLKEVSIVRNKWSGDKPYFFFVGSMHPRKNIQRLIAAFNIFKLETQADCKLLLGGSILWSGSAITEVYINSAFREDIIFTGRLSETDLQSLLGSALALTFVPVFEGFGMPLVEAMECGIPIICSNITSLPEVAGDAAITVDPYDIDAIASAMKQVYVDPELRKQLIERGYKQKKHFSWDKTSKLLWETIQKVELGS